MYQLQLKLESLSSCLHIKRLQVSLIVALETRKRTLGGDRLSIKWLWS
jgi:hypothetical protein